VYDIREKTYREIPLFQKAARKNNSPVESEILYAFWQENDQDGDILA
jgi:hypothetical protein